MELRDGTIRVLPQTVVEKIAAGEVVERPSSVMKELVENALDAGATRIEVSIEDAGFGAIRVTDDGEGMSPENLKKALLPHATSKIVSADDLFAVSTMGFRGEALASIGAVSRLSITSADSHEGLGYRIRSEGGSLTALEPERHTKGTTVACRDLFYNVPARKKFMKSRKAERTTLTRAFEQLVLPFPSVHFTLSIDGKRLMDTPPAANALERVAQTAGTQFARKLVLCTAESSSMSATIYMSTPEDATPRPRHQYLYVNLRRVDNDSVTYGIRQAFSRFIEHSRRPSWFCFLDIDPTRIDVNVHPTKQKIKFDDEGKMFGFIHRTVQEGVAEHITPPSSAERPPFNLDPPRPRSFTVAETTPSSAEDDAEDSSGADKGVQVSLPLLSLADPQERQTDKGVDPSGDKSVQWQKERWSLIPCYQIHRRFILASIKNGILLIDQHAAHERILFEQALADLDGGASDSQRLLFPVVVELAKSEKTVVLGGRKQFAALGFDIQDWGGNTIAVSAIPAVGFLRESAVKDAIQEMVEYLTDEPSSRFYAESQKRFAAAYACGAAIKFGQELKQEEMNSLLDSLFAAQNPYTCPHGRPTMVRISLDELARRFLR
ncbi:MAG: DNA mismatch repair endonuclease MutL [Chitinivibrionales bacterium]|nr:DNA mismatch repair endonuclease MutL [Chitinivibrionales bacterium]MBD3356974.1 DNA mismatch repair endonuclease MutL [Chitinivibrionales bacterium]